MPTRFPPAFDAFVAPARERNEIWRTLLGLILFSGILAAFVVGLILATFFGLDAIKPGEGARLLGMVNDQRSIFSTFALLGVVIMIIPALWPVVRFLHKRPLLSLISPNRRISWSMWMTAAGVVLFLGGLSSIITVVTEDVSQQMPLKVWAFWGALVLPVLFLQTTAEELLFRGYLQQQLAARFQSRWVWMVLPAFLFGLAHYNPETFGSNTWLVMGNAFAMGLIAADITSRLGNLSASMGLHFANNLLVVLIININGQMSGLSLFVFDMNMKSTNMGVQLVISIISMLFFYGMFVVIHRRRRM